MKLPLLRILLTFLLAPLSGMAADYAPSEHFLFRLPRLAEYRTEATNAVGKSAATKSEWLKAWPENGSTNGVEFSSRVAVQIKPGADLRGLIAGRQLQPAREVAPGLHILQAPDAWTAAHEAHRLAAMPEVSASYPVMREQGELHGPYAAQPTDSFYYIQWELEHRNADGSRAGVDLNTRAAWPYTTGQGVTIAVADTGVELVHPELTNRVAGAPHFNFADQSTNAGPIDNLAGGAHGTEVAGLAAASIDNLRMTGVAPGAGLASWVIFTTNGVLATDEGLMDMFQHQSNGVAVQNHSWGHPGTGLNPVPLLQQVGISNAIASGRAGRGVVMVRSAGNARTFLVDANDDGYPSDPRVIGVGAVRLDGRRTTYTQPGACLLVGAPSGDADAGFQGLLSTDLLGTRGMNQISYFPPYQDLSGYVFDSLGFSGTSASSPQISGVAALILAANPSLTYRDVQAIMVLASRHFDYADPDLATNGAGLAVSHSIGFGVPDAGAAVRLARSWTTRPPATNISVTVSKPAAIPDEGLRLFVTGQGVPDLGPLHILPSAGLQVETETPALPLVDFGYGTNAAGFNLTNKAALIQRDANTFSPKLNLAAQAGAAFAVVYNYSTNTASNPPGGDYLAVMSADFVPIPAVFLGHNDGEALKALFQTNANALAQIKLQSTNYHISIADTLICEHVGLRVQTDHQRRGDLRITLVSPAGTRSVLQHYSFDNTPGPVDWTYYSTHHFGESSAGTWTVYVSDEGAGNTGTVQTVSLEIQGVPIQDADQDGLDDRWELAHFGSLAQGPMDDPDRDGYNNAREQLMGTDPTAPNHLPYSLDLSRWNSSLCRLSWPSSPNQVYEVWAGTNLDSMQVITNVTGAFPETEWFGPYRTQAQQFFRVRSVPPPGTP